MSFPDGNIYFVPVKIGFLSVAMMNHTGTFAIGPQNQSMRVHPRDPAIWPRTGSDDPLFDPKLLEERYKQGVDEKPNQIMDTMPQPFKAHGYYLYDVDRDRQGPGGLLLNTISDPHFSSGNTTFLKSACFPVEMSWS